MKPRVTLFGAGELLRARTTRSLLRFGVRVDATCDADDIANAIENDVPTWFVRAGAWIARAPEITTSATGKSLVALGAIRGDSAWRDLVARSKGELDGIHARLVSAERRGRVASVLVESPRALRDELARCAFDEGVWNLTGSRDVRAVRAHDLDVGFGDRLRVCVAVPALRRGGAERIAIDIARGLRERGVAVRFVVTSARDPGGYDAPDDALFAPELARHASLASCAHDFGADVIHAHLFDADDVRALAALGPPVVVTVHNDRARWPAGFDAVTCDAAAATLGCSRRTTRALAHEHARVRFAPNCVDVSRSSGGDRERMRRALELPRDSLVVLCVANPRPQKRLELAVQTLAALPRTRDARLVIAGDAFSGAEGEASMGSLRQAIASMEMSSFVRILESQRDVRDLYAAGDVLLTTSAFEGMSVAQLEALAARLPVVTTDVGGAEELALLHSGYFVADASPDALAIAIDRATSNHARPELAPAFTVHAAAARHERVLRGAAAEDRAREPEGLVVVLNNFSTGGAQASAKRLLLALHERGHRVGAAVLQEQTRFPTRWREELARTIPIFVAPNRDDPAASAATVCDFVRARRARTVVFWNVMTSHKFRIADELVGVRLFDVSPGEMYFSALERYFEKPEDDLPFFSPRDYGELLEGVVVKFAAERERARAMLGARVHVVPNGVPHMTRRARPRGERFIIGTLARISPDKKIEELVEAARELSIATRARFELRIAGRIERGADAYARDVVASARDLPIVWRGEVDANEFLADLDAFAMVSEPEGCPNALLEAMSAALPVAATSVGGASEAIVSGESGLLTARGDPRALGRALARIMGDDALASRLAEGAAARIRDRYDVTRMTNDYESIFL